MKEIPGSSDDLKRLYEISLQYGCNWIFTERIRSTTHAEDVSRGYLARRTNFKWFLENTVPYLKSEEKAAVYAPLREIPKLLNHEDLTVRVIAQWRLEMGR